MTEPAPILDYLNRANLDSPPERKPSAIIFSLIIYNSAVFLYAILELFGWLMWGSDGPKVIGDATIDYGVSIVILLMALLGTCIAIAGLIQTPRKWPAAMVALSLNFTIPMAFGIIH